jgi:hypothetical protein
MPYSIGHIGSNEVAFFGPFVLTGKEVVKEKKSQ